MCLAHISAQLVAAWPPEETGQGRGCVLAGGTVIPWDWLGAELAVPASVQQLCFGELFGRKELGLG